ncbi:hypothetical protein [Simonsiella muelleri]|nr:hypothetical protein [Simonsiella muelleri]
MGQKDITLGCEYRFLNRYKAANQQQFKHELAIQLISLYFQAA